ncbi:MAG: short-chain dehydrogenase [Parafilimonas sp.]|nr:short-chain dehydrogenase [Parafilimonas sp.]
MTNDQIHNFLSSQKDTNPLVRISFKTRNSVVGIFIHTPDFDDLKAKNFWRIVSQANFEQWKKSKDFSLCRMFNGSEFTKLSAA